MGTRWLDDDERDAWVRFIAVVERLPGVLDSQLRRDAGLTHYEYFVLAMLSEAPDRTLRMTALAARTNATLPRLSHVVSRMEERDLVRRSPCLQDRRAFNVTLTDTGWATLVDAAPGHVATVREHVIDPLSPAQVRELAGIADAMLRRLDPQGSATPPARAPRTGEPDGAGEPDGTGEPDGAGSTGSTAATGSAPGGR
ncbi:MarR family winged helix-turn-helix transcriptional regulator [Cellulomonas aerilata]|uniref:MarR family transcriptional regulator n=1 Tax=Cellulomonas aerilata TaxID=515326 RepID=A0A512D9M6_9CELL|nr:MarR family winged helix-turn-helix transcriptional regulator [Cellulomonas aerilata]GEO33125.1 MarR family transcriptional regulator [Cellulomonas aerilata]